MIVDYEDQDKKKKEEPLDMVGINQTSREKSADVTRLNWIALREKEKEEPFRFLSGKDYPHLCEKCQAQVTAFAAVFEMGITEDTDDPEAPCNEVYDRRLFCGGFECVNRPKEKN